MISQAFAKKQVARLGQLLGFPKENVAALGELVLAVQIAASDAVAEASIQEILDRATYKSMDEMRCPLPADIRAAIYERQNTADPEARLRRESCTLCGGSGFRIVERDGLTGAAQCNCRRSA